MTSLKSLKRELESKKLPTLEQVDQILAEKYLDHFIKQAWHILEPGTEFIPNWHIDAICEHVMALMYDEIDALLINIPPRHMKSLICSVFLPAWVWTWKPSFRFLNCSYAQDLSVRDSLKTRRLIQSNWYQERWADKFALTSDQNQKLRFENNKMGYRLATSVDGLGTGEGGDLTTVDDPINMKEALSIVKLLSCIDWWTGTMQTRANDPKKHRRLVIMQRGNERDLSGHIIANETGWTHLCLPARYEGERSKNTIIMPGTGLPFTDPRTREGQELWPERFDDTALTKLELGMGKYNAAGQLQQRPSPKGGGMFRREWFEIIDKIPEVVKKRVRRWDLAATEKLAKNDPDFTAGARLSIDEDQNIYIEHVIKKQIGPAAVETLIEHTMIMDGPGCLQHMEQEGGASGKSTISHYQRNVVPDFNLKGIPSTGPKEAYADKLAARAEKGFTGEVPYKVYMVRGEWNAETLDSLEVFPMGAHDDDVDTISKAYCDLTVRQEGRVRVI